MSGSSDEEKIKRNVKAIGVLYTLWGSLLVLSSLVLLTANVPVWVYFIVPPFAVWILSTGIGILKLKNWARQSGCVLALFHLAAFPIGTLMGFLFLMTLSKAESIFE